MSYCERQMRNTMLETGRLEGPTLAPVSDRVAREYTSTTSVEIRGTGSSLQRVFTFILCAKIVRASSNFVLLLVQNHFSYPMKLKHYSTSFLFVRNNLPLILCVKDFIPQSHIPLLFI
jgi:hypothetical protein